MLPLPANVQCISEEPNTVKVTWENPQQGLEGLTTKVKKEDDTSVTIYDYQFDYQLSEGMSSKIISNLNFINNSIFNFSLRK